MKLIWLQVIVPSSLLHSRNSGCYCLLLFEAIAKFTGCDFHEKFNEILVYRTYLPMRDPKTRFYPGELLVKLSQNSDMITSLEFFREQGTSNLTLNAIPVTDGIIGVTIGSRIFN